MTMNQACQYLGKSRGTLYQWHKVGYLTYHHVGLRTEYEAEHVIRAKHPNITDAQVAKIMESLP